jgi:penicillin-binding protein 1A
VIFNAIRGAFSAVLYLLGFVFSWGVIGLVFAVLVVGGVIWSYGPDLPDHEELAAYEPLTLSRVYSGEGELLDEFVRERRVFTPSDEIPDLVKHAFISAEDKNFYSHWGFDPRGIAAAVIDAAEGGRLRGASTITQQTVKVFLLDGSREIERKIKEIILAVKLEGVLTKDQILELYLNEIFLGQNSYGVTAAARNYFAKTLEELTPAEAAYLAALPKAPSNRHPVRERETALFWRNNTLREMAENGYITQEERAHWQTVPLDTVIGGEIEREEDIALPGRSYFTDEVRRQLIRTVGEDQLFTGGLTIRATVDPTLQAAAEDALQRGLIRYDQSRSGYGGAFASIAPEDLTTEEDWRAALAQIRMPRDIEGWHPAVVTLVGNSSVRVGIEGVEEDEDGHYVLLRNSQWVTEPGSSAPQSPADVWSLGDVIYVEQLFDEEGNPFWMMRQIPRVQGAFMAMDTRTGRILALQGGFDFQHSAFNRATQATRQPGSAFKPFVYAAALDQGFSPATIVMDAPFVQGDILTDEERAELEAAGEEIEEPWSPKNYTGRFYGPQLMRVGIERSLNLMTVRIADAIGMRTVADYGEGFGIYDFVPPDLTYSLGSGETTLYRLVAAYAQFANGGLQVEPTLVDRVQDRRGNTIFSHEPRLCEGCGSLDPSDEGIPIIVNDAERVMSEITAFQLISMLEGVVDRGTASGSMGDLEYPLAGKTGTTNATRDAWFIGFTPSLVAGCFVGYDVPTPLDAGGGSLCGPIFRDFIDVVIETEETEPGIFQPPTQGTLIKMDRATGIRLPDEVTREEADYTIEVFAQDQVPEIYQEVTRSIGLAEGLSFSDLPETLGGEETELSGFSEGPQDGRPAPPKPPAGLGTGGGLY